MTRIKLIVTGAKARAEVDGVLTSGAVGIPVEIQCDSAWDDLSRDLKTMSGKREPNGNAWTTENVGGAGVVAHEAMIGGNHLYLGIEGRNADGSQVIGTTWADCGTIFPGASVEADPSADPLQPVWEKMQRQIDDLKKRGVGRYSFAVASEGDAIVITTSVPVGIAADAIMIGGN